MDRLLTVEEAAAYFQVVPKTINAWVRQGLLVPTELGGVRRFRQADLESAVVAGRRLPKHSDTSPSRSEPVAIGQGQGWNESACRPYGMTMAAWKALGLTREQWLAQQQQTATDGGRRRGRRRKAS